MSSLKQKIPPKCVQCIWGWFDIGIPCGFNMEKHHKDCKVFVRK